MFYLLFAHDMIIYLENHMKLIVMQLAPLSSNSLQIGNCRSMASSQTNNTKHFENIL